MSAFVVDSETMHDAVAAMFRDPPNRAEAIRLGQQLYELNIEAVHQRYPDDPPTDLPGPVPTPVAAEYRWQFRPASKCQQLKSLQCLIYQCSEGDVPERGLFRQMTEHAKDLAFEIVRALPQYEQARW